jgi:hypothetical protein
MSDESEKGTIFDGTFLEGAADKLSSIASTVKDAFKTASGAATGDLDDIVKVMDGGWPALIGFFLGFKFFNGNLLKSVALATACVGAWHAVKGNLTDDFNTQSGATEPEPEAPAVVPVSAPAGPAP